MGEGRDEIHQQHAGAADMALVESQSAASTGDVQRMGRITRMGEWLSVISSTVNGTELGDQE